MPDNSAQAPRWSEIPDPADRPLLSIAELARIMGLTRVALYKRINVGTFEFELVKTDIGSLRVRTKDVLAHRDWLNSRPVAAGEAM